MIAAWRKARREALDARVLTALNANPHGGYELGKRVKARPARVYLSLRRLETSGLVYSFWVGRSQPRRIYATTNAGMRAESEWPGETLKKVIVEPGSPPDMVFPAVKVPWLGRLRSTDEELDAFFERHRNGGRS